MSDSLPERTTGRTLTAEVTVAVVKQDILNEVHRILTSGAGSGKSDAGILALVQAWAALHYGEQILD